MTEAPKAKRYDLEERSFIFAKACRDFVAKLPKTINNIEDGKQLVRSSGSIAANYIEANEAKESLLWLRLLQADEKLQQERREIKSILSAIIDKV